MLIPFPAAQPSLPSFPVPHGNGKTKGVGVRVGVISSLEEKRCNSKQMKKDIYRAAERHKGDRRPTKVESPSPFTDLISAYIMNRGVPIPLSLHSRKHNMSSSYNIRPVEEFRDEEYPQLKGTMDPSAAISRWRLLGCFLSISYPYILACVF